MKTDVTRRNFLIFGGALAGTAMTGTLLAGLPLRTRKPKTLFMYRLSLRGRRGSQAAKKHNANFRFATAGAADRHRAHPGDNSRIVRIPVGMHEFVRLFVRGRSLVADLRDL